MKAIYLAAGCGRRFSGLEIPKALIEVDGKTLIERSISQISERGIKKAGIVTGHLGNSLRAHLGTSYQDVELQYCLNSEYNKTGTMYSLFSAREMIDEDILLFESDLIYEKRLIQALLESDKKNAICIARISGSGDEVFVTSRSEGVVDNISKDLSKKDAIGEFIGVSILSLDYLQRLFEFFEKNMQRDKGNSYEEEFIKVHASLNQSMSHVNIPDLIWGEIDNQKDLERIMKIVLPKLR